MKKMMKIEEKFFGTCKMHDMTSYRRCTRVLDSLFGSKLEQSFTDGPKAVAVGGRGRGQEESSSQVFVVRRSICAKSRKTHLRRRNYWPLKR